MFRCRQRGGCDDRDKTCSRSSKVVECVRIFSCPMCCAMYRNVVARWCTPSKNIRCRLPLVEALLVMKPVQQYSTTRLQSCKGIGAGPGILRVIKTDNEKLRGNSHLCLHPTPPCCWIDARSYTPFQLVLYAREERLAEQSPWPSRYRGNMPPPPGPGRYDTFSVFL